MIKTTLKEITEAEEVFYKLFNTPLGSAKLRYKLGRLSDEVTREFKEIEDKKGYIIQKYGTQGENANTFIISAEGNTEYNDFLSTEVEIKAPLLTLDDLDYKEDNKNIFILTAKEQALLNSFIDVPLEN
jgi:hypothetical protein